jgi:hypothetical protein
MPYLIALSRTLALPSGDFGPVLERSVAAIGFDALGDGLGGDGHGFGSPALNLD